MKLLFGYENVYFDSASDYDLSQINEKEYLKKLFFQIKKIQESSFEKFSFYALFSHNSSVVPVSATLSKKNKVLFWFSDESGSFPSHLINHYQIIFKSYIQKECLNVYSNPLGYVNEFEECHNKSISKKDISIFFSGNLNANRVRLYELLFFRKFKFLQFLLILPEKILSRLLKISGIKKLNRKNSVFLFSNGFKSGLAYKKYFDYLLRSKFILCPKGFHSNETFRHIEALHTGGIIISAEMPDVSIYKDNPFITFNSYSELKQVFKKIERNEFDLEELAERHKAFYNNNLRIDAVARRVSEICKNSLQ